MPEANVVKYFLVNPNWHPTADSIQKIRIAGFRPLHAPTSVLEVSTLMARSNSPARGHPKFPQAAWVDYDGSAFMAMRAAASLSL